MEPSAADSVLANPSVTAPCQTLVRELLLGQSRLLVWIQGADEGLAAPHILPWGRLVVGSLRDQSEGCPLYGVAAPMGGCWQQGMAGAVGPVPGRRQPVGLDPDPLPADVAFLGTGAQHDPACIGPVPSQRPLAETGQPLSWACRGTSVPLLTPKIPFPPPQTGPGTLPSSPSPSRHLATLGLIAQTALELGPALIWVEIRAILVLLPPSQPLGASLCIAFSVLCCLAMLGLLAWPAVGWLGAITLLAVPWVLVAIPAAAAGWSGWCPSWYLSPDLQGWAHWVTSVLALLPPSWWGWAVGWLPGDILGGETEGMGSVPACGTSLAWWWRLFVVQCPPWVPPASRGQFRGRAAWWPLP